MCLAEKDMANKSKLENAVKELELRYRKIAINYQHHTAQDIKVSNNKKLKFWTQQ